jgi:hypothetical protein
MRARWYWSIPALAILCLLAPILLTDRTFASDWGNHYWLIYTQALNIEALGEPSIYLQSSLGAFYPYYAFYGGTFYAVTGAIADLFGTEFAVLLAYAAAIAANYLGWTWMARMAGVRGWRAQLPGLIAVTAPLAVTNLYGRGDIPEAIATSMLPLVGAAGISLVREPRLRLRDAFAFLAGLVFLTGSHALSLAWGVVFLALLAVLLIACHWPFVKQRAMRLLAIAWLAVLAGAINAWMLVPALLNRSRILENEPDPISGTVYTAPSRLFSIFRNAGDPVSFVHADLDAELPVLALLWALACGAIVWRLATPRARALGIGLATVLAGLLALILHPALIGHLPEVLQYIQFPYRLLTYVDFCVVGLVTLALAGLERERGTARATAALAALAAIGLFSLVISAVQNDQVRSWLSGRDEAIASAVHPPPSWYAPPQFADGEAPLVHPTLPRLLMVPVEEGIRDSYRVEYPPGPAGTAQTNIATGSYLVDIAGATPVGRNEVGDMVVRLPASLHHPRVVTVSAEDSPAIVASRWVSLVSLLGALAAFAGTLLLRRRRV